MKPKEEKIIQLLNEGKIYEQIQQELGTSSKTIAKVIKNYPDLIKVVEVTCTKPPIQDKINCQVPPENLPASSSSLSEALTGNTNAENEKHIREIKSLNEKLQNSHESDARKDEQINKLASKLNDANKIHQKYQEALIDISNLNKKVEKHILENKNQGTDIDNLRKRNNQVTEENITLKKQSQQAKNDFDKIRLEYARYKAKILKEKLTDIQS